jgi:hypothetical protein
MTAAVVPSAATPLTTLLDFALAYSRRGWPVFPLGVRSKLPLIAKSEGGNGCLDATTDENQIRAWWAKSPQSNIGIATGRAFWVLDVDSKHADAAAWVETAELPATIVAITGTGGKHYLFARPDFVVRNSVSRIGPHIDVRGVSGYIVAPPSIHPDTGRCYEWDAPGELPEEPLAAAPDWLLGAMRAQRDEAKEPLSVGDPQGKAARHDIQGWLFAALEVQHGFR